MMNRVSGLALGVGLLVLSSAVWLSACGSDSESPPNTSVGGGAGAAGAQSGGSAGQSGSSGAAGTGGTPAKAEKIDLLLMVDNSASMADKQQILASTIPDLVNRLVNPACVDSQGTPVAQQPAKPLDPCPSGSTREFAAVFDIHMGVITSSLGDYGADSCSEGETNSGYNPRQEDMAHLISRSEADPAQSIATYQNKGFLYWDPNQGASPAGEKDIPKLMDAFTKIVVGAGQDGCGYEAPLESWYRFLVDPKPYQRMVETDCSTGQPQAGGSCRGPDGVDLTVLAQRKDFLRSDSLVAVLMLTDEDDCSVTAGAQSYIVLQHYMGGTPWQMWKPTSACKTDPNSKDCQSCAMLKDPSSDPACEPIRYDSIDDSANLRCYRQKQRFGMDFLYPTSRYVDALTKTTLTDGSINPLFCSAPSADGKSCTTATRDPSLVALAGIVGVPWQDIAKDPKDLTKGYKPAAEIPWDVVVGDLDNYVEPKDPLMIQSIDPRTGTNPVTGEALAPATASSPTANSINGHEWDIKSRNDLQFACTFKLPTPRDCSSDFTSCDCAEAAGMNNPLCQSDTGEYGKMQYRAKAYPGRRLLTVLKGLGSRAVVGSICPSNTSNTAAADYGYRPAIAALIARLKPSL